MREILKQLLQDSINRAYQFDKKIIEKGGMEQACVFRISHYFQCLISSDLNLENYVVDCEYNINGDDTKRDSDRKAIRPDLILHKRGVNDSNLLVVEFKGWWSKIKEEHDFQKLKSLTKRDGYYAYTLGAYVKLERNRARIKYFSNGEESP